MTAWFIVPYKTRTIGSLGSVRYCAMDDYSVQIMAASGIWREAEMIGGRAIVKVRASLAALTALNTKPGFIRIPHDLLNDSLADLSAAQRNAIKQLALDCGYTESEIQAGLGNTLLDRTVGDVLRFLATRRTTGFRVESIDTIDQLIT